MRRLRLNNIALLIAVIRGLRQHTLLVKLLCVIAVRWGHAVESAFQLFRSALDHLT